MRDQVKVSARHAAKKYTMVRTGYQRHHWSYSLEHRTDIIELKNDDHEYIHTKIKYDKDNLKYRRVDTGELLDTKEKHFEFIKSAIAAQADYIQQANTLQASPFESLRYLMEKAGR